MEEAMREAAARAVCRLCKAVAEGSDEIRKGFLLPAHKPRRSNIWVHAVAGSDLQFSCKASDIRNIDLTEPMAQSNLGNIAEF